MVVLMSLQRESISIKLVQLKIHYRLVNLVYFLHVSSDLGFTPVFLIAMLSYCVFGKYFAITLRAF